MKLVKYRILHLTSHQAAKRINKKAQSIDAKCFVYAYGHPKYRSKPIIATSITLSSWYPENYPQHNCYWKMVNGEIVKPRQHRKS